MRNPNGYGTVYKLNGIRRNPYIARKTVDWDLEGKPIYQIIGYFSTRKLGMLALADFNKNPYKIEFNSLTFNDVFELWKKAKFEKLKYSNQRGYIAAYNALGYLYNMKFNEIRAPHIEDAFNLSGKNPSTLKKMKVLCGLIYKFAMEIDISNKDYSSFVSLDEDLTPSKRKIFNDIEIKKLFEVASNSNDLDTVLIMIFTGFRIGELLNVKITDINQEKRYITGGSKTAAGKDRIVPINDKIWPYIEKRINNINQYLITNDRGLKCSYDFYCRRIFNPLMTELEMNHFPHDCRHTFATLLDNAEANKVSIKRLIGHTSQDLLGKVYTHKNIEELRKAIALI